MADSATIIVTASTTPDKATTMHHPHNSAGAAQTTSEEPRDSISPALGSTTPPRTTTVVGATTDALPTHEDGKGNTDDAGQQDASDEDIMIVDAPTAAIVAPLTGNGGSQRTPLAPLNRIAGQKFSPSRTSTAMASNTATLAEGDAPVATSASSAAAATAASAKKWKQQTLPGAAPTPLTSLQLAAANASCEAHLQQNAQLQLQVGEAHQTIAHLRQDVQCLRKDVADRDLRIEELQRKLANAEESCASVKTQAEEKLRTLHSRLDRYQHVMRSVALDIAKSQRREARRAQYDRHFDLGQTLSLAAPVGGTRDVWINGNRARGLMSKLEEIGRKQKDVENDRKNARARAQQLAAGVSGSDDTNSVGLHQFDAQLDAEAITELKKSELTALKSTETQIRAQLESIEVEKIAFCKEIRRIQDEDASPYCGLSSLGADGRYPLVHLLGKGGFSEVWKAFDLFEGRFVACKIHHIQSNWTATTRAHYTRHADRELEIQKQLDHPRLTKFYDAFRHDDQTFVVVMEYSEGEDLDLYLKRERVIKECDARLIMIQLLSALRHLNEQPNPIIHYDLKPANILFHYADESCLEIKVTDFGLSKIIPSEQLGGTGNPLTGAVELTSQGTGTYWYQPPECFDTTKAPTITHKVDIWAAGVIFYQMLFGKKPFADGESQKKIWHEKTIVHRAREPIDFPVKPNVSADAKDIIKRMLSYSPEDRPDIVSLSRDPYFFNGTTMPATRKRSRAGAPLLVPGPLAAAAAASPVVGSGFVGSPAAFPTGAAAGGVMGPPE